METLAIDPAPTCAPLATCPRDLSRASFRHENGADGIQADRVPDEVRKRPFESGREGNARGERWTSEAVGRAEAKGTEAEERAGIGW